MNSEDWKNATPEQIVAWQNAQSKIAWNTIERFAYQGAIAAHELLNYDAAKLYFALEMEVVNAFDTTPTLTEPQVRLYNEANALFFWRLGADFEMTPSTDVNTYYARNLVMKNVYFSRLVLVIFTHIRFIGYKLTIV